MDLESYASLCADDSLTALYDFFSGQPSVVDLAYPEGGAFADFMRELLFGSYVHCFDAQGMSVTGTRKKSQMSVVANMIEPLQVTVLTHLGATLEPSTYQTLVSVLPMLSPLAAIQLDRFLAFSPQFDLASAALRALGYDVWAFLVAGFAPHMLPDAETLFVGDLEEEDHVSINIVNAWTEYLHTM